MPAMARGEAYELFYWSEIQGRGEFVRLAFEESDLPYIDVARVKGDGAIVAIMNGGAPGVRPFAPPFVRHARRIVAQTANVLRVVGAAGGLAPRGEDERTTVHQHQLTIMDLVSEVHDTHHPIGAGFYYEEQKAEAKRRTAYFLAQRMPRFLGYFETLLGKRRWLVGRERTYADLSLFQVVEGLSYAFPNKFGKFRRKIPSLLRLGERVRELPRVARYLASKRRIPFSEAGIFRHYPELDR
jgi:glutathione S-transferase